MAVKIIKKTLKEFIKETVAFGKIASKEFGIPSLYINTTPLYGRFFGAVASFFILVDPAPPIFPHLLLTKDAISELVALWNLERQEKHLASLIRSKNSRDELEWSDRIAPIVRRNSVMFIFVDDASALPSTDFMERWSVELSVTIIARKG
jgi:hypothetical protein